MCGNSLGEVLSRENLQDELRRKVNIETLEAGPKGQITAFSISYESTNPKKAHSIVQSLVRLFVEPNAIYHPPGAAPANLEVLDEAIVPEAPSFPPHLPITLAGLLIGLLLGPVARATGLRFGRRPESAAA